jgi:RHS repeat-associated protein
MIMPGRTFTAATSNYRYGFNGKEKDNEVKGEGNQYDYGMRIYDPRVGRFLSTDPLQKQYPELTPYQFASNSPIEAIDLDGLEMYAINRKTGQTASGPLNIASFPASQGWITGSYTVSSPAAPQYSAVKPVINPSRSEAPPLAIQQQKARANNSQRPVTPASKVPTISSYNGPATAQGRQAEAARTENLNLQNGLNRDGSEPFLTNLAGNKTWNKFNDNIATPLMVLDGAYGLYRGGASLLLSKSLSQTVSEGNFVYRAIRADEAGSIDLGLGISAKNPMGTWSMEDHLIHGSSPGSWTSDPWIATTTDINIAKSFNSGNGIIKIDLSKLPGENMIGQGFENLPRSSPGYHYSVWQQEVSIKGAVPQSAISKVQP